MATPRIDLDGAVVLVTGAGGGIGAATALAFAERRQQRPRCRHRRGLGEADRRGMPATGSRTALAYGCDVADAEAVADLAAGVHSEHGPLDVLVNNAGVGITGELLGMTLADWHWVRGINLDGPVNCLRAFGPAMLERRTRSRRERGVRAGVHPAGDRAGIRRHQVGTHRFVAVGASRLAQVRRRCVGGLPRCHQHRHHRSHQVRRPPRRSESSGTHRRSVSPRSPPGQGGGGHHRCRRPRPAVVSSAGRRAWHGRSTGRHPCGSSSA